MDPKSARSQLMVNNKYPKPSQSRLDRIRLRRRFPAFLRTYLFLVPFCTIITSVSFLLAIVTNPIERPDLHRAFHGDAVRACYDVVAWTVNAFIARVHYMHAYPSLKSVERTVNLCMAGYVSSIAVLHILNQVNVTNDARQPSERLFGVVVRHISFLSILIVTPLAVFRHVQRLPLSANSTESPSHYPLHRGPVFPMTLVSVLIFWINYIVPTQTGVVLSLVASALVGISACVIGLYLLVKHGTRSHGNIGFAYLLHAAQHQVRAVFKILFNLLNTRFGEAQPNLVIFAFRTLFGSLSVLMDDLLPGMFRETWLWGSCYVRVGECIASMMAAFNYTHDTRQAMTFLAFDFITAIIKDSGFTDDLRLLMFQRVWLYSRFPPPSSSTSPDHASSAANVLVTAAADGSNSSSTTSTSTTTGGSGGGAPLLIKGGTSAMSLPWHGTASLSRSPQQHIGTQFLSLKRPTLSLNRSTVPPATASAALTIYSDLCLQLERTQQTFIARAVGLLSVSCAYLLAQVLGATNSAKINVSAHTHEIAIVLLVGVLVEGVLARLVAAGLLRAKIRYFRATWASSMRQDEGQVKRLRRLRLGNARLPNEKGLLALVLLTVGYGCSVAFGPWTL